VVNVRDDREITDVGCVHGWELGFYWLTYDSSRHGGSQIRRDSISQPFAVRRRW
jgi:hypothetical protein